MDLLLIQSLFLQSSGRRAGEVFMAPKTRKGEWKKLFLLTVQQGIENMTSSNTTVQTLYASKVKSKLPNCSNSHPR